MTLRAKRVRIALTYLLAALAARSALGSDAHTLPPEDHRWRALQETLSALQRSHSVPAMVLVVLDRGRRPVVVAGSALAGRDGFGPAGFGSASRSRAVIPTGFHAGSPFRWGSISKTVTALVALEAARQTGTLLSSPVSGLIDVAPYRNPWSAEAPVRLGQLLELSAGLTDLTRSEFDDNVPHPLWVALARHAGDRVVAWPPGLQHSYTNVAPGITAAVVERLTGTSFDEAARRLVFDPLGMKVASFRPMPGLPGGFRQDGRTEIPYWHVTFRAFGGLNASPIAMARLLEALLDGGRVDGQAAVAQGSVTRMFHAETTLGARHGLEITYGAGLYGWVRDGYLFIGHGGDADGYRSRFGLLPDVGRGYLLGIDVDDPTLLQRMQLVTERALTADLPAPAPPAPASLPAATLAGYAGIYYPSSTRFAAARWRSGKAQRARVAVEAGELRFIRDGRTERLIPAGEGRFRRPADPAVSVVFARQRASMYLQGELGNYVRVDPGPCPRFVPVCAPR